MSHRNDRRWWAAVAALTLLGAGIRAVFLHDSLYLDEYYAWFEIHGFNSPFGIIRSVRSSLELSPPLYYLLTLPFTAFSDSPEALRGPSFVLGTALIPLSAVLARRAGSRNAGVLVAALVALSPFLTYFATEARPYTTAAFFSTLFVLFALRAAADSAPANWVGLTLAGAAAIYTHYTTVFLVGAVLVWLFLAKPDSRRHVSVAAAVIGILFLPWLSQVGDNGNLFLYGTLHGRGLLWFLTSEARSLVGTTYVPLWVLPGTVPVLVAVVVLAAVVAAWIHQLRSAKPAGVDPRVGLLVASLAIPTGLVAYSTIANSNLLIARNFTSATPVALCLVAIAIDSVKRRQLAAVAAVALVVVLAIGATISTETRLRRSPQEAATRFIERTLPTDGIVLVGGTWCALPPGEQVTAANSLTYVNPSPTRRRTGQPACPHGVIADPSYFHGGSRGAVYLDPRYLIAPVNNASASNNRSHPAWAMALRRNLPVAVVVRNIDDHGKSSLWFNDPPPELVAKFRRECLATFSGLFPLVVTVWQPRKSPPLEVPARCRSGSSSTGESARYWRDTAILSFANGRELLPQGKPLQLADLVAPLALLLCLGGTLAYAWRMRESRDAD